MQSHFYTAKIDTTRQRKYHDEAKHKFGMHGARSWVKGTEKKGKYVSVQISEAKHCRWNELKTNCQCSSQVCPSLG